MPRPPSYDRETALARAVGLFWHKGYHGSSMKQIELALDMRPGSIYATFGSKDGLYSEALARYAHQGGEDLAQHMAGYNSVLDGLQAYLLKLARNCSDPSCVPARACLIVKTLLEASSTNTKLYGQAKAVLEAIEDGFTELLETARKQGELIPETDCRRLARLIQGQIMGLRSMAERDLSAMELEQLGQDMAAILDAYRVKN
ncbi:TetR/AcrR family transcriptional regulator [Marinobacter sp. SS5-14b]|uniref:TetR/AcrR family transcriptional regulator n=1 Tax=Marinobacter sp. SS5-14b TaxID=3050456 RepID=UPI0026E02316|nr:TetR/AcrR family transcriptional regulator [Marinobacter sp. SS5-14b]